MRSAFRTATVLSSIILVAALGGDLDAADDPVLRNPAALVETAPDTFNARFETTQGDIVIEVTRAWAPKGADRFYNLVKNGFFDGNRFFRVLPDFIVQWGMNGDPEISAAWRRAGIEDDPVRQSNVRGTVSFAMRGPNTRTTLLFVKLAGKDASGKFDLDKGGFAPFGRVVEGMDVVGQLYAGYGESAPNGDGPTQQRIGEEGNIYLEELFPELDFIEKASIQQ